MNSFNCLQLIRVFGGTVASLLYGGQLIHATSDKVDFFVIGFLVTLFICYVLLFLARFFNYFSSAGIWKLQVVLVIFSSAYILNDMLHHQLPVTATDIVKAVINIGYIVLPEVIFDWLGKMYEQHSLTMTRKMV